MPTAVDMLQDRNEEEAAFVHLHDIDCDVAEWWCHYILEQPFDVESNPLLEQLEEIVPRLNPLSKRSEKNVILRMRTLDVWYEYLSNPAHLDLTMLHKLCRQFEKAASEYEGVLRLLRVHKELLLLFENVSKAQTPEQVAEKRNAYTDKLVENFHNEVIPQELSALAAQRKGKDATLELIRNLVEGDEYLYGSCQVHEALRELLLKWCNELGCPRLVALGYRTASAEGLVSLPMIQRSPRSNVTGSSQEDADSSDTTKEIQLLNRSRSKETGRLLSSNKKKPRRTLPPPLIQSSSSSEEEMTARKRSKSLPSTSSTITAPISRKRGRAALQRRLSNSRIPGRSVSAARSEKRKRRVTQAQVVEAIKKGIAKYGHGNWTIIQKRSGGILKHMTAAEVRENAESLGPESIV